MFSSTAVEPGAKSTTTAAWIRLGLNPFSYIIMTIDVLLALTPFVMWWTFYNADYWTHQRIAWFYVYDPGYRMYLERSP